MRGSDLEIVFTLKNTDSPFWYSSSITRYQRRHCALVDGSTVTFKLRFAGIRNRWLYAITVVMGSGFLCASVEFPAGAAGIPAAVETGSCSGGKLKKAVTVTPFMAG